jgi:molybdopterin biosynthesis enzyme
MATLRSSAYPMVDMDEAIARVERAVDAIMAQRGGPLSSSRLRSALVAVASRRGVAGRVLAEDVRAPADVPARACSRLDGYAVRSADGAGCFSVLAARRAGDRAPPAPVRAGEVV